jgi:hypothetical protein
MLVPADPRDQRAPRTPARFRKVQLLLGEREDLQEWIPEGYMPKDFAVCLDGLAFLRGSRDRRLVVDPESDIGREVLVLLVRYAEGKIAAIDAELRSLGVEP